MPSPPTCEPWAFQAARLQLHQRGEGFPTLSAARCRDAEMQRWLELPAATQTINITVKTRNLYSLLDQGMRPLLEEGWTKAFQGVKAGVMGIKEDVVWLLKRARASLSQRPGILSFLGVRDAQSSLLLLQLGCAFIWLFCSQEVCGRMNLMGLFSHPPACPSRTPGSERQKEEESSSSVICGTGPQAAGRASLPLAARPHHCICLLTSRCSTGGWY